ncbi:MAG: TIGR04283 family arsenosugar biosynthesis glycosyltransferase [bacterium]|nr:MAG: TIGR04283 family arsenosugar biosynthesis glycosyltransferase [bacterium]
MTVPSKLIIFTRYPEPGTTKTRLIPALGPEGAADLHRRMTEHTLNRVRPLARSGFDLQVRYEGGNARRMVDWLGPELEYRLQGEGDLGARMERAFRESFSEGYSEALIIGSDCPSLTEDDVSTASALLDSNQIILGPATDGGYYLLGIRSDAPEEVFAALFQGIPWGTDEVLMRTVNSLAGVRVDLGLLDDKDDVDEPADLVAWERAVSESLARYPDKNRTISVIVPVFNEEERIGDLLKDLRNSDVEVVVSDGGSVDGTVRICREAGVRVRPGPASRPGQMNSGADAATGDLVLFLHADTKLPARFPDLIREAVEGGAVAGAFSLAFEEGSRSLRVIQWAANLRAHRLGVVFGDQAIFAVKEKFSAVGGFPDQPIMEDYELWRRLRRSDRTVILPAVAVTSARRWIRHGTWRTTFIHLAVTWLYHLGVSPDRLAGWYRRWMEKAEMGSKSIRD